MGADKLFKVKRLSDADAWKLFQALVGDETLQSHPEVWDLAEYVSIECCGLPLALVSIGRAVASKKTPQEWNDVLVEDQLQESIYNKLKSSYDNLQNDMFKSCFLYCCLFPINWVIKKRDLIDYWIGEGFLDDRLGAAQSQGHYIIDVLLSVCLLEEPGEDGSYVEMHVWIYDMSLWIASKIEMEKGNCFFFTDHTYNLTEAQVTENLVKATRMSLLKDDVIEIQSDARKCPNLQTLFLIFDNYSEVISNNFFRFMPSLRVLNLSINHVLAKLPSGISNLILLQHLDLSCTGIQELPKELRDLKKLKCLNLENTRSLHTIPRQLISKFSVLHVLRLWECRFMLRSTSDSVVRNDAQLLIEELLCLKNLSMLSITLDNSHALQRLLSSNRLRSCIQSLCLRDLSHPKSIKVPLTGLKHLNTLEIAFCNCLRELEVDFVGEAPALRESPCSFYFLDKVIIMGCPKLRELTWLILAPNLTRLTISDCNEMEEIINVGKLSERPELMGNVIPFSKLKFLTLKYLPKLRSVYWSDLPFPDLKKSTILQCPMLPRPPHRLNKIYVLPGPSVIESGGTGRNLEVPSNRDVSAESAKMAESAIENPVYQANKVIESGGTGKSLEVPSNRDVSVESAKMAESAIEYPVYKSNQVIESGGTGKNLEVPSNRDVSSESAIEYPIYQSNQVIESGGTGKNLEVPSNRDVSSESAIEYPIYQSNQVIESGGTGKSLEVPSNRDVSAESAKMAESAIENPVYQANQVIESGGDVSAESAKMAESAIKNPVCQANQVIESGGTGKSLEVPSNRDVSVESEKMAESAIENPVYQSNQVIESGGTGKSLEVPSSRDFSPESAVSAALFLVKEVLSFPEWEANLQKDVRGDVQNIRIWLSTLQAYLKHMDGKEGDDMLKYGVSQIRDLAYDIEDVLDEFRVQVAKTFYRHRISKYVDGVFHQVKHWNAVRKMSSELQSINRRINDITTLDRLRFISPEEGSSSGSRVELYHVTPKEDDMVGFEGYKETLINHLVGDSRSAGLKHIWVVGIGCTGKTILVKNVYERKEVLNEYDCHAWIHVSRSCKINEVLRSILKQLCKERKQSDLLDEGEVRDKLKSDLQQRRYLLVLDDVWGEDDWKCIVHALPQGSGGSKIMVTSPKHNLAKSCVGSSDYILEIKGLEWKEAWNLFCKKAFPSNGGFCPGELEEWSQKIVKRCEGLPLAIATVGSLLSNKRQIPIEWKKVHDSLGSVIDCDSNLAIISRIMLPSYKDLSINLKNCFLYFSIFPEDYSIARERLIRLWIAEGFIEERRGKTAEDVAEDYLNELIGRNLVEVSKFDFNGRVSFCRVQNLIKEFIILKSKDENFVKVLAESDSSSSTNFKIRRLSIHHSKTRWSDNSSLRCVRSLFIFEWDASLHCRIRKLLQHLKLVRSLDLEGAPLTEFPEEIVELTLLKYLSLRGTQVATVPKSIKKLAYLETLDLKQTCVTKLPFEIYALKRLRHLLVYRYNYKNYVAFDSVQGVEVPAGVEGLSAIQKLSLINATKHKKIVAELKALVQLRKLGLIGLKREDGRALCASIKEMEKLLTLDVRSSHKEEYIELDDMDDKPPSILQRLHLKGRLDKIPRWISSLHSLVRICLRWSRLETSPLEALQVLPNLMELEMVDAYTGDTLEFNAETFKELKFLHLEQIDRLHTVIVEAKAMPKLEKLTICKCEKMEMLPLDISNLTKLRELLVYDMHNNFIDRLQKNSDFRYMIEHIPVIHSFTLDSNQNWSLQKFS